MTCHDCHIDTRKDKSNFYMVHDQLWEEFGEGENYLCWDCFENRIGRKLQKQDFTKAICNVKVNPKIKKITIWLMEV